MAGCKKKSSRWLPFDKQRIQRCLLRGSRLMALPGRPPFCFPREPPDERSPLLLLSGNLSAPSPYRPYQRACSQAACQRQRRRDYHRQKIASDPVYRQVCLESPRKWREVHADYWKQYRQDHPQQVERNRLQQRWRDEKRRLVNLANNTLATCKALNTQSFCPLGLASTASCKQHPSGVAPAADL